MAGTGIALESLGAALEAQRERLLPCVHCGFCLPACPTYNRLGDENDSPRGRLHLMKAVVEGRLDAGSEAFHTHIDRCLGCRACEPVCPSGVEYGTLLELARSVANTAKRPDLPTRLLLGVMAKPGVSSAFFAMGRLVRATGIARLAAKLLPARGVTRQLQFGLGMLAGTAPWAPRPDPNGKDEDVAPGTGAPDAGNDRVAPKGSGEGWGSVALLEGCVQRGLYARVNDATVRTLSANGFSLVSAPGQVCCGALHAHAGELEGARELARRNIVAFESSGAEHVTVNAAGCGAAMKEYGTLLEGDPDFSARAQAIASKVRDVTELLAQAGPRAGAAVESTVVVDHPCHLMHGQSAEGATLRLLEAVPGVAVTVLESAAECCGGAGIYGLTHPELGGQIGRDKITDIRGENADLVCTANPGCMMQIGAGLLTEGVDAPVAHPVEVLDESYRRAGYYA